MCLNLLSFKLRNTAVFDSCNELMTKSKFQLQLPLVLQVCELHNGDGRASRWRTELLAATSLAGGH